MAVADFDGIWYSDILLFEPSSDALLPEFLPYLVQSDGFFDHALGTSAAVITQNQVQGFGRSTRFRFRQESSSTESSTSSRERSTHTLRTGRFPGALDTQRDAVAAEVWRACVDEKELSNLAEVTVGIVVKPAALYVATRDDGTTNCL